MTEYGLNTTKTLRQQEITWLNIIHETHDQFCDCKTTLQHLLSCINNQNNPTKLPKKQIEKQLCLLTGESGDLSTGDGGDAVDALDFGDLEELFSGDVGDPDEG